MDTFAQLSTEVVARRALAARELYHRLLLLIGPAGTGKTAFLLALAAAQSWPYRNLNLELSRRMLALAPAQRALEAGALVGDLIATTGGDPVILDNLEALFHPALRLDPLRLLKECSRHSVVVASWNGALSEHGLAYAVPGHPEYRRYAPAELDFLTLTPEGIET